MAREHAVDVFQGGVSLFRPKRVVNQNEIYNIESKEGIRSGWSGPEQRGRLHLKAGVGVPSGNGIDKRQSLHPLAVPAIGKHQRRNKQEE